MAILCLSGGKCGACGAKVLNSPSRVGIYVQHSAYIASKMAALRMMESCQAQTPVASTNPISLDGVWKAINGSLYGDLIQTIPLRRGALRISQPEKFA